ncbi:hypothetical protein Ade02nite_23400 [Paractinoplanes deccanensis]|uniref:Helix-turn-helix domain-containing protein n=1 Tax=Paractinoplanes deccanensis TaxID=113561 RepID=A0ABQ3Y120_9ACTN|nr:hypothetical protein [Actinoplanes deccanensis]GID73699.1 hypothetical protein Ade02nite_23400 [Actinoplanes deccanensis]
MTTVARRTFSDRVALDRDGVATQTGVARTTVINWIQQRARFGFPEGFTDDSGREWFWADDIDAFHAAHQAAKLAELTEVDRGGDPNELVTSGEAARILGYSSYRNLPVELTGHPDHVEILSDGRRRRFWYRRTVWAHADARRGRQSTGHAPRTTGPRKPHPYADDPRLQAAADLLAEAAATGHGRRGLGAELARRLGVAERTAQRLLTAAEADQPS